jgi:hypothetical protein
VSRNLFLFGILAFATSLSGQATGGRLKGCPEPDALAKALVVLQHSNWREVNVARVQAMWPTELLGIDCDSAVCTSIASRGRVINGVDECAEAFMFDLKQNPDGTRTEQLQNITIHYSASTQKEVIDAARTLAKAMRLSETELASVGRNLHENFHWEDSSKEELFGLSLDIIHRRGVWTLDLGLSRFSKRTTNGAASSPDKFECIGQRRSAWCTRAGLSDRADSETPRRLPHATTACWAPSRSTDLNGQAARPCKGEKD